MHIMYLVCSFTITLNAHKVAELKGLVDEVDGARAELQTRTEAVVAEREDERRRSTLRSGNRQNHMWNLKTNTRLAS